MDSNALSERREMEELSESLEEAQTSLMKLVSIHKELSKRLGAATMLSQAKSEAQKHVEVSILQSPEAVLTSPSSWRYQTPSPQTRPHSRVWSMTTCHSPLVSDFSPRKPEAPCECSLLLVLLVVVLLWVFLGAAERLRSCLVVM